MWDRDRVKLIKYNIQKINYLDFSTRRNYLLL
ncbi:hypothetical protein BD809_107131 [Aquimarina intermedia]|uniref:Uncharacterized protein n=1 Tax=Aquimarina intermedia TaxID=350814 RepID=A0A5S5C1D6_9FLAO|nr:hypothetical protein BD809_107131 [Aquimarina intermedia]